jgi:hypothetical protein
MTWPTFLLIFVAGMLFQGGIMWFVEGRRLRKTIQQFNDQDRRYRKCLAEFESYTAKVTRSAPPASKHCNTRAGDEG